MAPTFVMPDDVKTGLPSQDTSGIKQVTDIAKSGNSGIANITELVKEGNKMFEGILKLIEMGRPAPQVPTTPAPINSALITPAVPTTPAPQFSNEPTILKEKVKPIILFNSKNAVTELKALLAQGQKMGFVDTSKSLDYFLTNELPALEESGNLEKLFAMFVNKHLEIKYS